MTKHTVKSTSNIKKEVSFSVSSYHGFQLEKHSEAKQNVKIRSESLDLVE
jgi:hypothetical protein